MTRRHQKVRRILREEAGGCCAVCGYERSPINLHFHHVDPATKSFAVNSATGKALATLRAEAAKCVLVCANCHGEIEAGLIESPVAGATNPALYGAGSRTQARRYPASGRCRPCRYSGPMRVSAKADYAVRAMVELASSGASEGSPAKGEVVAAAQGIPVRFLENIFGELRVHGLLHSRRGSEGGYWLARQADDISLAEIIRAVEGPLATVHGEAADEIDYVGGSKPLREVWLALRTNIRQVLESVTLADVVGGALPEPIPTLAKHPDATLQRDSRFAQGPAEPR